jgi:hypothetical protein
MAEPISPDSVLSPQSMMFSPGGNKGQSDEVSLGLINDN